MLDVAPGAGLMMAAPRTLWALLCVATCTKAFFVPSRSGPQRFRSTELNDVDATATSTETEWSEFWAEEYSRPYWHNSATGETTWERPPDAEAAQQPMAVDLSRVREMVGESAALEPALGRKLSGAEAEAAEAEAAAKREEAARAEAARGRRRARRRRGRRRLGPRRRRPRLPQSQERRGRRRRGRRRRAEAARAEAAEAEAARGGRGRRRRGRGCPGRGGAG